MKGQYKQRLWSITPGVEDEKEKKRKVSGGNGRWPVEPALVREAVTTDKGDKWITHFLSDVPTTAAVPPLKARSARNTTRGTGQTPIRSNHNERAR